MLEKTTSVISRATARIKRIVTITELVIQLMFIGYYAYLLVVNYQDIVLLIAYSILIFLATAVFFVMIFTLDPYQKRAIAVRKQIRKIARIISWLGKMMVVGYNIYRLVVYGLSETGQLLLIFSIIIFLIEVGLFLVSTLFSYYSQLFLFALQMDYQHIIGEKEEISEKPIGRILLTANNNNDREQDVNNLFVEHEIYDAVKKYSLKGPLQIIGRRKLEKRLLNYYNDTKYYYSDNNKLVDLYNEVELLHIDKNENTELFILKFFLINKIEQAYLGLNEQYFRFVLCGLSYYLDVKQQEIIDIIYHILIKHLSKNKEWNKLITEPVAEKKSIFSIFKGKDNPGSERASIRMYNDVFNIISISVRKYEEDIKKTIGGEIETLVTKTITKKVKGSFKNKFKNIFKKKKD